MLLRDVQLHNSQSISFVEENPFVIVICSALWNDINFIFTLEIIIFMRNVTLF